MVHNGAHKCSHRMTPVEEEKTIPEDGGVSVSMSVKKPASLKVESPKKLSPVQEETRQPDVYVPMVDKTVDLPQWPAAKAVNNDPFVVPKGIYVHIHMFYKETKCTRKSHPLVDSHQFQGQIFSKSRKHTRVKKQATSCSRE
nr:phosphatidylinositol/phosphatidylcholine transfer protein SFH3-like isoform X1 [Ipomoea batatas]